MDNYKNKGAVISAPNKNKMSSLSSKSPLKNRGVKTDIALVRKMFKELEMKQANAVAQSSYDNESTTSSNSSTDKKKSNKELVIKKLQDQFNILTDEYRDMELHNDRYKQEIKQLKVNNNELVLQLEEAKRGVLDLLDNFRILQKKMVEITKRKEEREAQFKALLLDSKEKSQILEELKKKDLEIKEQNTLIEDNKKMMNSLLSKNNLLQISIDNIQNKLELACSLNEEMNVKVSIKDTIIAKLQKDIETSENNSYRLQAEVIRTRGLNTLLQAQLDTKSLVDKH